MSDAPHGPLAFAILETIQRYVTSSGHAEISTVLGALSSVSAHLLAQVEDVRDRARLFAAFEDITLELAGLGDSPEVLDS